MEQLFVPGRLCLFGEHSDWAGAYREQDASIAPGTCIVCGTDQGIRASVTASTAFEFVTRLANGEVAALQLAMDKQELLGAARAGGFFSYAAGVAVVMLERYGCRAIRVAVESFDLPMKRGLSSSAAVCVLIARAFNRVCRLGLTMREEMELAYLGEAVTGSRCGRMDQACAYGPIPVLLRFDGDDVVVEELAAGNTFPLLIVDLCRHKDTRRILADLNECFTGPASAMRRRLRRALGDENQRIVDAARWALRDGDSRTLGALMIEAQQLFDCDVAPASPTELSAPRLHTILSTPEARDLSWGGKGVGSQGDGAAQFVCRGEAERAELSRLLIQRYEVACLNLTIRGAVHLT